MNRHPHTVLPGSHIFTLGTDHWAGPLGAYVSIVGCDYMTARDLMHALHGRAWAFGYSGSKAAEYLQQYPESRCVRSVTITTERPAE